MLKIEMRKPAFLFFEQMDLKKTKTKLSFVFVFVRTVSTVSTGLRVNKLKIVM